MFRLVVLVLLALYALAGHAAKSKDVVQPHYTIAICEYGALAFIRDATGKVIGYRGIMWELLKWISEKMKFKYTLVHSGIRLDPFPNGTWGGIVALLESQRVDIAFAGLAMAPNIFRAGDLTATVSEEPIVALLPVPVEENRALAIIKPFSLQVWLLLFLTILVVSLSLLGLKRAKKILTTTADNTVTLEDLALSNLQLITGQGGFDGHSFRPLAQRVTLAGWTLAVLIFVNSYTGSYISYATAPKLVPLAETLQDLAYRATLQPLSLILLQVSLYVNQTGDPAMKIIGDRIRNNPNSVLSSGNEVVNRPRILLELSLYNDLKQTGRCRCSISKTPIIWEYYTVGVKKGSTITTQLSKEILHAKEVGLVQHWIRASTVRRPEKCLTPEPSKIRPLMLKDLSGAFVILVTGIVLSVVAFAAEVLAVKKLVKRMKTGGVA